MKLPLSPPTDKELFSEIGQLDSEQLSRLLGNPRPVDTKGRYLHWDQLRHREPPPGHNHRTWWFSMSMARRSAARELPLKDVRGENFWYSNIDLVQELVHRLDREASGHILVDETVMSAESRERYLVNSLREEAIRSSQLEGASTTRGVAKEMLGTGRPPRSKDEHMIANNYAAMLQVERWANEKIPLELDRVLDLHRIVTQNTLCREEDAGRLQTADDRRVKVIAPDQTVVHNPPPAEELQERLQLLCEFGNGEQEDAFIHPVVRAILLHFAMGYDHPFADGNGRTARSLFYWSLIRSGYWLASYVSISQSLYQAPSNYSKAYQYVATGQNDVTYFILHQLEVLLSSVQSLREYLARKMRESRAFDSMLRAQAALNDRQKGVLGDALREPKQQFTIEGHRRQYRVSYAAARKDLLSLEEFQLLTREKIGKKFIFRAVADLSDRLNSG